MSGNVQDLLSEEDLVNKLIEIRKACRTSSELLERVNEWFVTARFTKEQKQLAFRGMYQYFDRFHPVPPMTEMVGMWHLCDMMDYVDTDILLAERKPHPKAEPARTLDPVLA